MLLTVVLIGQQYLLERRALLISFDLDREESDGCY